MSRERMPTMQTMQTGATIRKGECVMGNVNQKDRHGHTPLMDAAKAGDMEALADLLARGADITARSEKGKSALHYAAANGKLEAAKLLVEKGAELDPRDRDGHTPLMLAAIYGCNQTVQLLVLAGADVNARTPAGTTAKMYAQNNSHPLAAAILDKAHRLKGNA
jgi:ankyrin repeat protein